MCLDREILFYRYHADFRVYAEAERSLEQAVGANFFDAFERANRARLVFEKAREQLNRHIQLHRCSVGMEFYQANPPLNT